MYLLIKEVAISGPKWDMVNWFSLTSTAGNFEIRTMKQMLILEQRLGGVIFKSAASQEPYSDFFECVRLGSKIWMLDHTKYPGISDAVNL